MPPKRNNNSRKSETSSKFVYKPEAASEATTETSPPANPEIHKPKIESAKTEPAQIEIPNRTLNSNIVLRFPNALVVPNPDFSLFGSF